MRISKIVLSRCCGNGLVWVQWLISMRVKLVVAVVLPAAITVLQRLACPIRLLLTPLL